MASAHAAPVRARLRIHSRRRLPKDLLSQQNSFVTVLPSRRELPASSSNSPCASPLLRLPPELRTQIFQLAITLPKTQAIQYVCPHIHLRLTTQPNDCTHRNDHFLASRCGHQRFRRPLKDKNGRAAFWSLILANRQIHSETVGMVSGLNAVKFPNVHHVHCFAVLQSEIQESTRSNLTRGPRHLHSQTLRNIELCIDPTIKEALHFVVLQLATMKSLERIALTTRTSGLREEAEYDLPVLMEDRLLPQLRSCELTVLVDRCEWCQICRHDRCAVWKQMMEREVRVAAQINVALVAALGGRS